jgi:hypothetical protein
MSAKAEGHEVRVEVVPGEMMLLLDPALGSLCHLCAFAGEEFLAKTANYAEEQQVAELLSREVPT